MSRITYSIGLRTDTGQQREHNEDAGAVLELPGVQEAFVVCDGMGGLRSGEVASGETVRVVGETLREFFAAGSPDPIKALGEAFRRANDQVNALNTRDRTMAKQAAETGAEGARRRATEMTEAAMGTTCVAGVVLEDTLYLAHAGDSRAYRWRRGHLTRLTDDHSFVAERVKAGDMTEDEARVSRYRNMITKAIGIDDTVEPDFLREPLQAGDRLVVCSDGLTTMLDDPDIAALMNTPAFLKSPPDKAAATLVDAANRKGGHDNITVLILQATAEGEENTPLVLDVDAPRARRTAGATAGCSPALGMLAGALLLAAVIALSLVFAPVREWAVTVLGGAINGVNGMVVKKAPPDYRTLEYAKPVRLTDYLKDRIKSDDLSDFLARGDLLSYTPGVGLFFVAQSTGKVAIIKPDGTVPRSIQILETVNTAPGPAPSTHVFMTSDPQGNVYFSYTAKRVIEKKGPDGKLLATLKGFQYPEAIAVDENGNLYVVDFNEIKVCQAHAPGDKSAAPSVLVTPGAASPAPSPSQATKTGGHS